MCLFFYLLLLPPHADKRSVTHLLTFKGDVHVGVFLAHWQSISWRGHSEFMVPMMWVLGSPLRLKLWLTRLQEEAFTCVLLADGKIRAAARRAGVVEHGLFRWSKSNGCNSIEVLKKHCFIIEILGFYDTHIWVYIQYSGEFSKVPQTPL